MNEKININTEKLNVQVDKMKKINQNIESILDEMKKNIIELKDSWSSKTSNIVFEDFEREYKNYEAIKKQNTEDIMFLENVIAKYSQMDDSIKNNSDNLNA